MPSRRRVLSVASLGLGAGLAGCSSVLSSRPEMDLTVANYRDAPIDVEIAILKPGVEDRDEARVYRERVEIPRMSGEDDLWRREAVAPSRLYRIELVVETTGNQYDYRYEPSCSGDEVDNVGARININDDSDVRFTQSECSNDGLFS